MSFAQLIAAARHPRTLIDSFLTYPRFLGVIKPELMGKTEAEFQAMLASWKAAWWPAVLAAPVGRRIVAISPHPDDETIGAGGLLIAHQSEAEISIITIFEGDGGGFLPDDVGTQSLESKDLSRCVGKNLLLRASIFQEG